MAKGIYLGISRSAEGCGLSRTPQPTPPRPQIDTTSRPPPRSPPSVCQQSTISLALSLPKVSSIFCQSTTISPPPVYHQSPLKSPLSLPSVYAPFFPRSTLSLPSVQRLDDRQQNVAQRNDASEGLGAAAARRSLEHRQVAHLPGKWAGQWARAWAGM